MRVTIPLLLICKLSFLSVNALAVPPYLAIQTQDKVSFTKDSCPVAAQKTLRGAGFAKVVRYKQGSSVFAAYRDVAEYQYKAVIKCEASHHLFIVTVVANSPGKALKKATQLRQNLARKATPYTPAKPKPKPVPEAAAPQPLPPAPPSDNTNTVAPSTALATDELDAEQQFMVLGEMYYKGKGGVEQDPVEALRWYQKAADEGNIEAQYNLGVMYYRGRGAPQDFLQAYQWFSIAAAYGHQAAQQARDELASNKLSQAQLIDAQQAAREWFTEQEK